MGQEGGTDREKIQNDVQRDCPRFTIRVAVYANVLLLVKTLLRYISDQLRVMASFHCHPAIIKSHLGRVRDCLDQWPAGTVLSLLISWETHCVEHHSWGLGPELGKHGER